ncbi:MAG: hypothetical protein ACKOET_16820, partial [Verrucomicrobiota bacterium]
MKRLLKPEWFVRLWLVLCATGMIAAVWSSARAQESAPATNAPPSAAVAMGQMGKEFVQSHRSALSFGLDRVAGLQGS